MKSNIQILDLSFTPFIDETAIAGRIADLAQEINAEYKEQQPVILTILNGSFVFAADLFKQVKVDAEIAFIKLSSYQGTNSSGRVQTILGLDKDLKGRDVILVEDIIDTGKTLSAFIPQLKDLGIASLKVVTLLFKPSALVHPLQIDWVGFEIENKFVVGYGLDYEEKGRNLPCIYQLYQP